jgi:hypothetical protein
VGGLGDDDAELGREFFAALRPAVAFLLVLAYVAPLVVAIAYDWTRSERDSLFFWLGGDAYLGVCLAWLITVWSSYASIFTLTRFARLRPMLLRGEADHRAFDKRSQELFIVFSVFLALYLSLWCFLVWS